MRVSRTTSPTAFWIAALCLMCATSFLPALRAVANQKPGTDQKPTDSASKEATDKTYRKSLDEDCCGIVSETKPPKYPSFEYETAVKHEIEPHRRTIHTEGIEPGFHQLRLTLTVSPAGDVIDAKAYGESEALDHWKEVENEVRGWKFTPLEKEGKAVTAEVEEYLDLVPPERFPKNHVTPPLLRPDSKVKITLERTGCYGTCPAYTVTLSTEGIAFDGRAFVVVPGKHSDKIDSEEVRRLARSFVAADFFSMDSAYWAPVTDVPSYRLTITVDGSNKKVDDYEGSWVGMPEIITELEDGVDALARTDRWVSGAAGLFDALKAERFNFRSVEAQKILMETALRGQTETVREFLEGGVPLSPLPGPVSSATNVATPAEQTGWLTAACRNSETLRVFIDAGASRFNQKDMNMALALAARFGNVESARALIAYGADPNADLSKQTASARGGGVMDSGLGKGSVLINAAGSGNPDMVREILRYHPDLEVRDKDGETAIFAASESGIVSDESRPECVRLLAEAGADLNARDKDGNTPLHVTYLTDVEEELLKLGADVNARNNDGETPIFTTLDDDAIPLFIKYGADLTIQDNDGQTVMEARPSDLKILQKAIQEFQKQ